MSKRIICDLSFIVLLVVSIGFFFSENNYNSVKNFYFVLAFAILLSLTPFFQIERNEFLKAVFNKALIIFFITVLLSYSYTNYKEKLILNYIEENNTFIGKIYYDDPVHNQNGNLLVEINSTLNLKLRYKIRFYDNKMLLKKASDGASVNILFKNMTIKDKSNYGEFDYKNYLKGTGVSLVISIDKVLDIENSKHFYNYREYLLKNLYRTANHITSGDVEKSEFIYALISGSKSGIDEEILENFIKTSTIHLLTVSGFHFGIIYICLERIFRLLKLPRNIKLCLLIITMSFYYLITPMKFSCLRALVMIIIMIVSKLINKQFDFMCALAFVVILSIILNPYVVYDLSFVLTYLACLGIGLVYKKFSEVEKRFEKVHSFVKKILSILILSISIQLTLMLYFSIKAPNINLLTGLINIPLSIFISLLMSILIPYFIISNFEMLNYLNNIFNAPNYLIELIYSQVKYFSSLDIFIFNIIEYREVLFVLIGSLLLILYLKQNTKKFRDVDTILILSIILIIIIVPISFYKKNEDLRIVFNDIGQGDSAIIITEKNKVILVDLGDGKVDISNLNQKFGINNIDVLIFSHGHSDHTGGDRKSIDPSKVKMVIAPSHMKNMLLDEYENVMLVENRTIVNIDSIKLDIMPIYLDDENLNNAGILVKLTRDNLDVLFTGDIESGSEEMLIGDEILESVEILKVAHHGSNTSSTESFVSNVRPRYAVIPVGSNKYGHPSAEVVARYENIGSKVIILKDTGQTIFRYKDGKLYYKSYFK